MIIYRPASSRGSASNSWITSRRTFSNNSYYDSRYMNWGPLKVINDDVLQPDKMVPKHEHKNYNIFGYIVEGALEHWDTLGNRTAAVPGQIQHMWCGRSIWHTERCVSATPARYLQIWLTPNRAFDTNPYYELYEKGPEFDEIRIPINCDLKVSGGILSSNRAANRSYLYVVSGSCAVAGQTLTEGDGGQIVQSCEIIPLDNPHILLFEQQP
jgi:redox-sensitive bicupin YhaK (pirin superfamily)